MAILAPNPRTIAAQQQALAVLADISDGCTRAEMYRRGFASAVLNRLLLGRLAIAIQTRLTIGRLARDRPRRRGRVGTRLPRFHPAGYMRRMLPLKPRQVRGVPLAAR